MRKLRKIVALIIVVIVAFGTLQLVITQKEPVSISAFKTITSEAGFKVETLELNPYIENFQTAATATKNNTEVMYFICKDEETARKEAEKADNVIKKELSANHSSSVNFSHSIHFTEENKNEYAAIESVNNVVIIAVSAKADKDTLKDLVKKLY